MGLDWEAGTLLGCVYVCRWKEVDQGYFADLKGQSVLHVYTARHHACVYWEETLPCLGVVSYTLTSDV